MMIFLMKICKRHYLKIWHKPICLYSIIPHYFAFYIPIDTISVLDYQNPILFIEKIYTKDQLGSALADVGAISPPRNKNKCSYKFPSKLAFNLIMQIAS